MIVNMLVPMSQADELNKKLLIQRFWLLDTSQHHNE